MSTIDNKVMIRGLIENHGQYSNDPQVQTIWQYWSVLAKHTTWGIYYNKDDFPYGGHVWDIILLWSASGGITPEGKTFMEENAEGDNEENQV